MSAPLRRPIEELLPPEKRDEVRAALLAGLRAPIAGPEWLHLSDHLPEDSRIGGLAIIRRLRRHHAVHHDPRLMQRWNFNVTIPFWTG